MSTARFGAIKRAVRDMTIRVGRFDATPDGDDVHNIELQVTLGWKLPLTRDELAYLRLCWADAVAMG